MDERKATGHPGKGHETRDIAVGKVAWVAVGLAVLTALGALVAYLTFEYLVGIPTGETVAAPQRPPALPPLPRLQVQAVKNLNQMQEEAENRLNSYGWSDPANELVRIPIERAMDLIVERGGRIREEDSEAGEPGHSGGEVNRE